MPESRDRVSRPADIAAIYARRRQLVRRFGAAPDEPGLSSNLFGSPFRWGTMGTEATREPIGMPASRGGGGLGRGGFGTPRSGNGRARNIGPPSARGENTPAGAVRRGRGRSTNSPLLPGYPRTPLGDITTVIRGYERRRARLREGEEGQEVRTPLPLELTAVDLPGGVLLEHNIIISSPKPTIGFKRYHPQPSVAKVRKILHDATNKKNDGESDFITPQKRLLNSIETVAPEVKVVLEEMDKTPTAKKMERERKVRTLMSMR